MKRDNGCSDSIFRQWNEVYASNNYSREYRKFSSTLLVDLKPKTITTNSVKKSRQNKSIITNNGAIE
jgi:hypothetical protein